MRLRPLRAELLLAWAAAVVGTIGIVSALTPEMANRIKIVRGVLPPGWPEAARVLTVAFAIGLIWLARSLARRRRRAWQLAIAVVVASAVAHLAKGLDVEEATISLVLLAALLRYRRRFDVPGDPASVRPVLAVLAGFAAIAAVSISVELRGAELPHRAADGLIGVGIVLAFLALWFWLRPFGQVVAQTVGERRVARALVEAYGSDSLSFFALRRDKSYLFSPTRNAFLAYRVVAGTALVSGDPVGDEGELDALLAELQRLVRANGWRLAVVGASDEHLERYRAVGLKPVPMGEEAVLRPAEFSLEGRAIRKVRQSVSRLQKAGYEFRVAVADAVEPALRAELDTVSETWRGDQPERGFSMAIDDLYVPGTMLALAEHEDGRVGGFLHLAPSPAGGGWSLSTMRRRPDAPNGLTEFLIVETLAWAKAQGASEVSLNFCALTDFLAPERATTPLRRLVRRGLLLADNAFQLERLYAFNRKFFPEWRRRYICVERFTDLPAVGLAYLHAESLLVPPGPWTRRRTVRRRAVA
ncbi:MAG TPA: phosphatidylglycerol lysyltransferase domain-containing protein [Gaiellaceae bacterium]|jgi:lysyl-tRNA synthetase class 2|nr:phosphatidylglycerol lysyltransferase domain-containing protein [Gaiellaceae bacterium]